MSATSKAYEVLGITEPRYSVGDANKEHPNADANMVPPDPGAGKDSRPRRLVNSLRSKMAEEIRFASEEWDGITPVDCHIYLLGEMETLRQGAKKDPAFQLSCLKEMRALNNQLIAREVSNNRIKRLEEMERAQLTRGVTKQYSDQGLDDDLNDYLREDDTEETDGG